MTLGVELGSVVSSVGMVVMEINVGLAGVDQPDSERSVGWGWVNAVPSFQKAFAWDRQAALSVDAILNYLYLPARGRWLRHLDMGSSRSPCPTRKKPACGGFIGGSAAT